MCIVEDTKGRAAHGRGGTHANRAKQAVQTGVVPKEEPKKIKPSEKWDGHKASNIDMSRPECR